jgi:hypothetical protein
MQSKWFDFQILRRRPLLSLPQVVLLLVILAAIIIALDLNRQAQAGRVVDSSGETLQAQIDLELTRQVELQATLDYVTSEDYVAQYARDEGGQLLEGEQRVVPLLQAVTPAPTPLPPPTPDPALNARPWQAWWTLLTDAPQPSR